AAAAEEALLVVAQSGLSWTEAAELQRTSLALCEACRRCIPVRVRVGANTPRAVWARAEVMGGGGSGTSGGSDRTDSNGTATNDKSRKSKRQRRRQEQRQRKQHQQTQPRHTSGAANGVAPGLVPRLKILSLVWGAPAVHLDDGGNLPAELTELTFCRDFNRPLSGLRWPPMLARLTFGSKFNRPLSTQPLCRPGLARHWSKLPLGGASDACGGGRGSVTHRLSGKARDEPRPSDTLSLLPGSLKELTLGKQFNKPLPRSVLPPGLVSLTLGRNFRHHGSVRDAVWPSGLKVIRFGEGMLKRQLRDGSRLEAMRGLLAPSSSSSPAPSSSSHHSHIENKEGFAWPDGLERVEFWQEGRTVVTLKGGKDLDPESIKWLCRN
ncbi:unnamed protein product, partial [Hapterophycus canaliculatus]